MPTGDFSTRGRPSSHPDQRLSHLQGSPTVLWLSLPKRQVRLKILPPRCSACQAVNTFQKPLPHPSVNKPHPSENALSAAPALGRPPACASLGSRRGPGRRDGSGSRQDIGAAGGGGEEEEEMERGRRKSVRWQAVLGVYGGTSRGAARGCGGGGRSRNRSLVPKRRSGRGDTRQLLPAQGSATALSLIGDKRLIHNDPARIVPAAPSLPVPAPWHLLSGKQPPAPPHCPAWLPTSALRQRKAVAPVQVRDTSPELPASTSLCHRELHQSPHLSPAKKQRGHRFPPNPKPDQGLGVAWGRSRQEPDSFLSLPPEPGAGLKNGAVRALSCLPSVTESRRSPQHPDFG